MASWQEIDEYLKSNGIRIGNPTLRQTTGGIHARNSYHYIGTARDYGVIDSDAKQVALVLKPIAELPDSPIAELFFAPLNIWYKNGKVISGGSIGGHRDHCHVALKSGAHLP